MLLTSTLTVPVEVLNQHGETISRGEAKLTHMHGDCAVLHFPDFPNFPTQAPQTLIHWGTLLRFWISDGPFGYEIDGIVVAHKSAQTSNANFAHKDTDKDTDLEIEEASAVDDPSDANPAIASLSNSSSESCADANLYREVVLRLVHSRPFSEHRTGPRRWKRFGVRFQRIGTKTSQISAQISTQVETLAACTRQPPVQNELSIEQEQNTSAVPNVAPYWERAWAIDLSAGGIRLRTHSLLPARQLYALQFWLPGDDSRAVSHARSFALRGRVVRSQQIKSRTAAFEAMLGFEQLTAEDGLALSEFLSN